MISINEVIETNAMISKMNLDVRTITMGISLLDCVGADVGETCEKIYTKITTKAKDLVFIGNDIGRKYGIPIVNKRISITPIALIGSSVCKSTDDYVTIAKTLDKAADAVGVNFIGGYSALVCKGMTPSDELLIRSIPEALACTGKVCSSVNVGSTKTGIDMDAVKLIGEMVKETAELTKEEDSLGCCKFVVFCNAPDDNPFMAGAFHGVTEGDCVINVGVSGPGVVKSALEEVRGENFEVLCETIKKTAFKVTRVGQLVAKEASERLGVPFGIVDLSLAPTPAIGDSVGEILEEIGLEYAGAPGTTAALALLNERLSKLNPKDTFEYASFLEVNSMKTIMTEKNKRFNVTSSLLNQELYKINAAIVNHFITINALEMARDDLIPLIGSEVIIGTGFISNNNAMQITNDVIGLFQAILAQNVEQTKIMLERLNNMPNIDVTKLNANVNGYIEMLEEKNRSLEM